MKKEIENEIAEIMPGLEAQVTTRDAAIKDLKEKLAEANKTIESYVNREAALARRESDCILKENDIFVSSIRQRETELMIRLEESEKRNEAVFTLTQGLFRNTEFRKNVFHKDHVQDLYEHNRNTGQHEWIEKKTGEETTITERHE